MTDCRNMLFRLPVEIKPWEKGMDCGEDVVMLGSCFAERMAEHMQTGGIPTLSNPLGVLYNPQSIALTIAEALREEGKREIPLVKTASGWQCWWAGTQMVGETAADCQQKVNRELQHLKAALIQARWLFITLGTCVCYELKGEKPLAVTNCLKQPAANFDERWLDVEECVQILSHTTETLQEKNPSLQVVFTSSPYRYAKYGFHQSQLAKATLLLAVDRVIQDYPGNARYFPAYEIVTDELRDYRFYAADMLHPSEEAAAYVWLRFQETAMSQRLRDFVSAHGKIEKTLAHRPQSSGLEAFRKLKEDLLREKAGMQKKWEQMRTANQ